ncbi:hypothetical protein CR983_01850 [Candidatus Saccharibacteria bacterium]|nr:MAG: hypothetical protein CR983_01850 [Candidatus Saccharibacteria bacterium]
MAKNDLSVIGRNARVDFGKRAIDVPAKIDTGADSSAVWASNIRVDKSGVLKFSLFGEGSRYYNGKVFKRTDYSAAVVKSSSGHREVRYRTHFTVRIGGKKIRALFNLSERSLHEYPVLIGRRTLSGKFLVDVSKGDFGLSRSDATTSLNEELVKNPRKFYRKYHKKEEEK